MVMTSSSQTSSDHPHDAPHAGDNTPGITEPSTSGGDVTMKKHEPKREVQNEFSKSEPEEESETKEDRKVVEAASSTKKVLEVGYEPNNEDVICSWARQNHKHPGNQAFRKLVEEYAPQYMEAKTKHQKSDTIETVIQKVRTNGGSFLRKDPVHNHWFHVDEIKARDKVCHAIRKAALKIGKKLQGSDGEKRPSQSLMQSQIIHRIFRNENDRHTGNHHQPHQYPPHPQQYHHQYHHHQQQQPYSSQHHHLQQQQQFHPRPLPHTGNGMHHNARMNTSTKSIPTNTSSIMPSMNSVTAINNGRMMMHHSSRDHSMDHSMNGGRIVNNGTTMMHNSTNTGPFNHTLGAGTTPAASSGGGGSGRMYHDDMSTSMNKNSNIIVADHDDRTRTPKNYLPPHNNTVAITRRDPEEIIVGGEEGIYVTSLRGGDNEGGSSIGVRRNKTANPWNTARDSSSTGGGRKNAGIGVSALLPPPVPPYNYSCSFGMDSSNGEISVLSCGASSSVSAPALLTTPNNNTNIVDHNAAAAAAITMRYTRSRNGPTSMHQHHRHHHQQQHPHSIYGPRKVTMDSSNDGSLSSYTSYESGFASSGFSGGYGSDGYYNNHTPISSSSNSSSSRREEEQEHYHQRAMLMTKPLQHRRLLLLDTARQKQTQAMMIMQESEHLKHLARMDTTTTTTTLGSSSSRSSEPTAQSSTARVGATKITEKYGTTGTILPS